MRIKKVKDFFNKNKQFEFLDNYIQKNISTDIEIQKIDLIKRLSDNEEFFQYTEWIQGEEKFVLLNFKSDCIYVECGVLLKVENNDESNCFERWKMKSTFLCEVNSLPNKISRDKFRLL